MPLPTATAGGIIPAYAGSTLSFHFFAFWSQDHPRIRGEHIQKQSADSTGKGSSPHTRGAPHAAAGDQVGDGIIPAYAGSTGDFTFKADSKEDHPRIRGEHTYANMEQESILGSSPHTRGARSA